MNKDEQYERLRNELNKNTTWPLLYMFKFILPADNKKIALVESRFTSTASITQKQSSTGKYISITVTEMMPDADSIIDKYREMGEIEDLIAL